MSLGNVLLIIGAAVVAMIFVGINGVLEAKARQPRDDSLEERRRVNPWYSTPEEQEEYRNPKKYRTPPE